MKQRVISVIVASLFFIPILIIGGTVFNIAFYVLTLLALREFLSAYDNNYKIPNFIKILSYVFITLLYFSCTLSKNPLLIEYKLIAGIFTSLLISVVLYHDKEVYSVENAFYLSGGVIFLGFSMSLFYLYRNLGINVLLFLVILTILTDSYAFFTGKLIGKHKLLKEISPNKTWEGAIGGSLISTIVSTVYYITMINQNCNIFLIILMILFLTIVGQLGDLFFSAIKRNYKLKDFSNIMPGHGGILDRLDSLIFVMYVFIFFLKFM